MLGRINLEVPEIKQLILCQIWWDYVTTIYLFYVSNTYISMYIFVCIYMCVCIYIYIYVCVCVCVCVCMYIGFPYGANDKEPSYQCRGLKRRGFDPWVKKIP